VASRSHRWKRSCDWASWLPTSLGIRIQRSADAFAGQKLYLGYRSVLGQEDRIEVDLNFLFRLPISQPVMRSLWQPGALDRARVRVVSLTELLVGKLLALLDRGAARDVWDVANLSQDAAEEMAAPLFRARFIAMSAVLAHPLWTYSRDRLTSLVTDRAIAEQLMPMLTATGGCHNVDLVNQAWSVVAPLLALNKQEEAYLAAIQRGELFVNLLFPNDVAEAERMAKHPAILWKLANVRAHRTGHGSGPGGPTPTDRPEA